MNQQQSKYLDTLQNCFCDNCKLGAYMTSKCPACCQVAGIIYRILKECANDDRRRA